MGYRYFLQFFHAIEQYIEDRRMEEWKLKRRYQLSEFAVDSHYLNIDVKKTIIEKTGISRALLQRPL